jgi:hypothetical protein
MNSIPGIVFSRLIPGVNQIDGFCQVEVFFRDGIARIMGAEMDFDPIPNIRPQGMVIVLFGQKSDLGHKSKSLTEIFKSECC